MSVGQNSNRSDVQIPPELVRLRQLMSTFFQQSLPGSQFGPSAGSSAGASTLMSLLTGQPASSFASMSAPTGMPFPETVDPNIVSGGRFGGLQPSQVGELEALLQASHKAKNDKRRHSGGTQGA